MRTYSRRHFLSRSAGAVGAVALPAIIPASALGKDNSVAPSERITMGAIGVGGMGRHDLGNFMTHADVQVVAVCEVDAARRNAAKQMVDARYGASDCAAYVDFREVLARDDIDAVVIATPDHWHALIAIAAAQAGKDIYCEKPISVTVAEGRAVAEVMRRYGAVYQSGTQRRSIECFAFPVQATRNGLIGKLHTIHTYLSVGQVCEAQPKEDVPDGFDYERWLGPAPDAPYTRRRCHGSFRWIYDYSGGQLTDIGAHFNDLAQWGHNSEDTGPVGYEGWAEFPKDGLFNTPVHYHLTATYADGVKLIMHDKDPRSVRFEGDEGWVSIDDSGFVDAEPKSILGKRPPAKQNYDVMTGHHRDFLDCVKKRGRPIAPPEVAHRSTTVCHAANICFRLGRSLKWDPTAEQFIDDPAANRMLARAMRASWSL